MRRAADLSTPRATGIGLGLHYDPEAFGRFSEAIARTMGTARFLVAQTVIVVIWIAFNGVAFALRFDPYPFILLNLAFSTQAAYAAPLILLAGNRSAQRDRLTLEHAAKEADVEEKQNVDLLRGNREILEHVQALEERILQLEQRIVSGLTPPSA